MKLAEALMERADLQKRLAQLGNRLRANAQVQEGEKPAEDPQGLLQELQSMTRRLEALVTGINLTNSHTLAEGETITALLSRRDAWQEEISQLRSFLECASRLSDRARMSEIKILSTVDVAALQKKLDEWCRDLRLLDGRIQAANWTTEIDL